MKKVVVATDVKFWYGGAGHCTRITTLLEYLSKHTLLTVVFGGPKIEDKSAINSSNAPYKIVFIDGNNDTTLKEYADEFRNYVISNNFDVCIIEYIELSFLLNNLPNNVKVILDTHDLVSDRIESFASLGIDASIEINGTKIHNAIEEFKVIDLYSNVILINNTDYAKALQFLRPEKLILAPHPPKMVRRHIRKKVNTIGFVASNYRPNVHGIVNFLELVWPSFRNCRVQLDLYGQICDEIPLHLRTLSGLNLRGFNLNLNEIYDSIDIAINPVTTGAGLKIKNVEALGHGIPLITTRHSARGIEDGIDDSFLVADTPADFVKYLHLMIENYDLRSRLSNCANNYITKHFSPTKCFGELLRVINT